MLLARARFVRGTRVVLTILMSVGLVLSGSPASSMEADLSGSGGGHYGFKSAEICFMRKINQARARRGLPALSWDKQLGYVARKHARQMASNRSVYHDPNMGQEVTRWRSLAQNTGRGGSCRSTFRQFMRSAPHRYNIMDNWRFLGVGIDYAHGAVYVQQIFESRRDPGNVYHWP